MTDRQFNRRRRRLTATVTDLGVVRQRAFLVRVTLKGEDPVEAQQSLAELGRLVDTAGSHPVGSELQRRALYDPGTLLGRGKAEELAAATRGLDIDVVVFDNSLTASQQRNLQQIFQVDVVDREAVILDIFAQHASTRDGMLQVELAQLRYRLPRLRGIGTELSRLGGGIGTRGPGETKLETDRRRILERIRKLEGESAHLARVRSTQRKARRESDLLEAALVGYTNAGKSTLLNRLTDAGVLVEDRLFSTLDSTVRRLDLPGGQAILVADTVGFVRRLPHRLIDAFRSTLEEVVQADLLLHVVDGSDPDAETEIGVVRDVLAEIGAGGVPELVVLNKADAADPTRYGRLRLLHPDAVAISALTGNGIDALINAMIARVRAATSEVDLLVPYDRGDLLAALHRRGEVISAEHVTTGTRVRARLPKGSVSDFSDLLKE